MIMQLVTSLERIYDILDEQPEVNERPEAENREIAGKVEFQDVTFGYKSYLPVLEHVSFTVEPGEMIGLVGPSGAGKSTLINLIMRLYDVDDGSLLLDGRDIRDYAVDSLHRQIGVVLQETFLFSGTIYAMPSRRRIHRRLSGRPKWRTPTILSCGSPMDTIPMWGNPAIPCPAGNGSGLPSPGRFCMIPGC